MMNFFQKQNIDVNFWLYRPEIHTTNTKSPISAYSLEWGMCKNEFLVLEAKFGGGRFFLLS